MRVCVLVTCGVGTKEPHRNLWLPGLRSQSSKSPLSLIQSHMSHLNPSHTQKSQRQEPKADGAVPPGGSAWKAVGREMSKLRVSGQFNTGNKILPETECQGFIWKHRNKAAFQRGLERSFHSLKIKKQQLWLSILLRDEAQQKVCQALCPSMGPLLSRAPPRSCGGIGQSRTSANEECKQKAFP